MSYSKQLLVISAAFLLLLGFELGLSPDGSGRDQIFSAASAIALILFCRADALERGRWLSHGEQLSMLVLWPLAVPVYLFQTRSWRGCAFAVAMALLLAGSLAVAAVLGGFF